MARSTRLAPLVLALPLVLPFAGVGAAWADGSANANLSPVPLNGSQGSGTAMVTVEGTSIDFTLAASGLADGPHAAHIHFGADARHECPTAADETDGDDRLSTTEGGPAYGPVVVSLTRTGDTSPKSTLAVERFASGSEIEYMRGGVEVEQGVADAVEQGQAVVVVHGVAYEGARAQAKSDLNPALPAAATDPAVCGVLSSAPSGGAATGAGGTAAT
ncbi:MAG: CHRD domain-containing protein, partial [Actinomycetota bacterium]|nr:CHRD domain-containing protein [Actinomycetota bacterium]